MEGSETRHAWPRFLPDGLHLLFVSYTPDGSRIEVMDSQTGQRKVIREGGSNPRYAASGHLLYVDSSTLYAAPFDIQRLEVTTNKAEPVVQEVGVGPLAQGAAHYAVSLDGTLVYQRETGLQTEQTLVWVDQEGKVTPASKMHFDSAPTFPRLSPDGQHLAFAGANALDGNRDIWIVDLERDLQTRLTTEKGSHGNPIWSPDGNAVYFHSNRGKSYGIFRKQVDGSGEAELVLESDTPIPIRDVSPDGRYLAYCPAMPGTLTDIFLLPLEGDLSPESFAASPADQGSPRFSPDGRWIAYDSDETGRFEIYLRRFPGPGGKFPVSGEGGSRPQWSQDGRRLFYRTDDAIWVSTLEGQDGALRIGKARRLVELESIYLPSLVVAPDEERFMLVRNEEARMDSSSRLTFVFNWFEELERLVPAE
jgi:Tol biopolymer transport system component